MTPRLRQQLQWFWRAASVLALLLVAADYIGVFAPLNNIQSWFLLFLASYVLILTYLPAWSQWHRLHLSLLQILPFIATFVPLRRDVILSGKMYSSWSMLLSTVGVFALCLFAAGQAQVSQFYQWLAGKLDRMGDIPPRVFVPGAALLSLLIGGLAATYMWGRIPHLADGHAMYVHAKIFATGHLCELSHPLKQFFGLHVMINNGNFCSFYPPGYIALLAIGVLVGLPWLVNPVLAALHVIAVYLLAQELCNRKAGYIAVLLALSSPAIVQLSASYMSHTATLLFLTSFMYTYIRYAKTGSRHYAVLTGVFMCAAMLSRPQSALPFAVPVFMHIGWQVWQKPKAWRSYWGIIVSAVLVPLLVLKLYTSVSSDYSAGLRRFDTLSYFTPFLSLDRWLHIFKDIDRMLLIAQKVHTDMLGWQSSSLLCVLLLFLLRVAPAYAWMLAGSAIILTLALIVNPFPDLIYGARYLHEMLGVLIVLTAIFIYRLPGIVAVHCRFPERSIQGATACALALIMLYAFSTTHVWLFRIYNPGFYMGNLSFYEMLQKKTEKPALLFVQNYRSYKSLYFLQPPYDENPIIAANASDSSRADNDKLRAHYPNRHAYVVTGSDINHSQVIPYEEFYAKGGNATPAKGSKSAR